MEDRRAWIRRVIAGEIPVRIDIRDDSGELIGSLTPLTRAVLGDQDVIDRITRWRNLASKAFLTQFTARPERTRRWLESVVLPADDRLLFLIRTPDDQPIGHYGFIKLDTVSAEVDNLVRGESGGSPRLIPCAERALIAWLFDTFALAVIRAHVLAHNPLALALHRDFGFVPTARLPLCKATVGEELHLSIKGVDGEPSPDNLYLQRLEVTPATFRPEGDAE
jgi:RimJ/RimL family protein N-acetyltransferase